MDIKNIPGQAIAGFGQDIIQVSDMMLRNRQAEQQQAAEIRRKAEFSKAYTDTLEAIADMNRTFQEIGDTYDETGRPHFLGFDKHFESRREEIFREVSKNFTDPQTAEMFFPTYNEMMSQVQIDLEDKVFQYDRERTQKMYFGNIDRIVQMPNLPANQKKSDINAEINAMIQGGIVSREQGEAVLAEKVHQVDYTTADAIATELFNRGGMDRGFNAARAHIMEAEGLSDEDRKKLLSKFSNEDTYRKKQHEEWEKEQGDKQYLFFRENIQKGNINDFDHFYDSIKEHGGQMSTVQIDKLSSLIKGAANDRANPGHKSDQGFINNVWLAAGKGMPWDGENGLEQMILDATDPEKHEGPPPLTAVDANKLIDDLKDQYPWFSAGAADDAAQRFRRIAEESPEIIHPDEVEGEIADMLKFIAGHVDQGEMRSPYGTQIEASLVHDYVDARLAERYTKKVGEGIRAFGDSFGLPSRNERVLTEAEEGLYTGILKEEILKPYFRSPALPDYDSLREEIAQQGWARDYDQLSEAEKNRVDSNVNMVQVTKNLMDAARDELAVHNQQVHLDPNGYPFLVDADEGIAYKLMVRDKDEQWFYWDKDAESWLERKYLIEKQAKENADKIRFLTRNPYTSRSGRTTDPKEEPEEERVPTGGVKNGVR